MIFLPQKCLLLMKEKVKKNKDVYISIISKVSIKRQYAKSKSIPVRYRYVEIGPSYSNVRNTETFRPPYVSPLSATHI